MKIYLCHSWTNSVPYQSFVSMLKGLDIDGERMEIVSKVEHNLTMALGSPEGQRALLDLMQSQMSDADVVLLPSYLLVLRRYWALKQLALARRALKKPVAGLVGAPNDPLCVPYEFRYLCDRIIDVSTSDVGSALGEFIADREAI